MMKLLLYNLHTKAYLQHGAPGGYVVGCTGRYQPSLTCYVPTAVVEVVVLPRRPAYNLADTEKSLVPLK